MANDEYFLNYSSKLIDMLGQTLTRPSNGVLYVVVEQTYDAQANVTKLRLVPRN